MRQKARVSMLQQMYGDPDMSRTRVIERYIGFKEGREDIEDNPRPDLVT